MKALGLLIGITLLSSAAHAQNSAMARMIETQNKDYCRILLTYDTGESEVIPVENFKIFGGSEASNASLIANQKAMLKLINDMSAKGYKATSINSSAEAAILYTAVLFTKE